ncbi:MAG: SRPBCC domain-containing protein [Mycobacteriaceae bacterium]|uniref:SRPBCC domain-containing protein n=1 Tax=Corynebacterium sp. TaxID=1720 RepID=UPI003F9B09C9
MTDRSAQPEPATLDSAGGRHTLNFDRVVPCSVQRMWRAATAPEELELWFPATVEWTPRTGEMIQASGMSGEVIEVDAPPSLPATLSWTFAGDGYRIEVDGIDDGTPSSCRLIFSHTFADGALAAQTAAGWEAYLRKLDAHLIGGFLADTEAHAGWSDDHERYAELFGVDPSPGRAFWAEMQR